MMAEPPVVLCHMCGGVVLRAKANIMYVEHRDGTRHEKGSVCQKCTEGIQRKLSEIEAQIDMASAAKSANDLADLSDDDLKKGVRVIALICMLIGMLGGTLFGGLMGLLLARAL